MTLIERIEAATGPDRELDLAIKALVYGGFPMISPFNGEWCLYREKPDDPRRGRTMESPRHIPHHVWMDDRYTASLDAALTLLDGLPRLLCLSDMGDGTWIAKLWKQPSCAGNSASLAIICAALRAREASHEG